MKDEKDYDVLVCAPVGNFGRPIYGSLRGNCLDCNVAVWISVSGQKAMRENANLKVFCMECTSQRMEAETGEEIKISAVPGALEEIKGYFGKIGEN